MKDNCLTLVWRQFYIVKPEIYQEQFHIEKIILLGNVPNSYINFYFKLHSIDTTYITQKYVISFVITSVLLFFLIIIFAPDVIHIVRFSS